MRNIPGRIGHCLFHTGAEPLLVARFRLANILSPGGIRFLLGRSISLLKKVPDEPVQIAGRQLAGVFEDFGGAAVHGKIVSPNRLQSHMAALKDGS
jgi:hypothetical protein